MKYLILALLLVSCAHTDLATRHCARGEWERLFVSEDACRGVWHEIQCEQVVCVKAEIDEGVVRHGDSYCPATYDPIEDHCICQFRDGRLYTTPRK